MLEGDLPAALECAVARLQKNLEASLFPSHRSAMIKRLAAAVPARLTKSLSEGGGRSPEELE